MAKARGARRGRRAASQTAPAAVPGRAPPDPEQEKIDRAKQAVADRQPSLTVLAGRLVRKYSLLERDEALYEVQTDKGFFEVIRSRDGSLTVFDPQEK